MTIVFLGTLDAANRLFPVSCIILLFPDDGSRVILLNVVCVCVTCTRTQRTVSTLLL
jgi:hypothetical protein